MIKLPYLNIDMKATGSKLQQAIKGAGYSVKAIQEHLRLSCPQSIYRWFKGQILPSVNHLYMLSLLVGVSMEELLVIEQKNQVEYGECVKETKLAQRLSSYQKLYIKSVI